MSNNKIAKIGPLSFIESAIENRSLIGRLTKREIAARYRGSLLGMAWLLITPLLMLGVYTFVFSVIFQARWGTSVARGDFALFIFSGLILFNLFSECIIRAPGLMLENVSYIKKVVFPIEIQAWVTILVALVNAILSSVILLVFYFYIRGTPPITALLTPLIVAPILLISIGSVWILSSLGVFLRDLRQLVGVIVTVFMFLCPIFYPIEAVPEKFRWLLLLNPISIMLEESKKILFFGVMPDWNLLMIAIPVSWLIAWLGYWWFMRTKKGFADVL